MKVALLIVFAAVMLTVVVVVFQNRDSPEIVSAAVPVAFGAASALWLVFAFARPAPIDRLFPVTFIIQKADKQPVAIPGRAFPIQPHMLVSSALDADPKALDEPPGTSLGAVVYHELLQRALVDWIASRHFGEWRMEINRFNVGTGAQEEFQPLPDAGKYGSTVLSAQDIERRFAANRFARFHTVFGTLALPKGTELQIRPPQGNAPGEIRLKNKFCDIKIATAGSLSMIGLGGYRALVGLTMDEAQAKYWWLQFTVRANVTFARRLMGHPHMDAHREWANGIVQGLAYEFDEESLWRRAKENFSFQQQLETIPGEPKIGIGPIHSAPPPKPAADPAAKKAGG